MGEGEDGGGAGGIVVGAVVDGVGGAGGGGVHGGVAGGGIDAEVVEVGGKEDGLGGLVGAAEDGDGVPGLFARGVLEFGEALPEACGQGCGQGALLEKGVVVAAGFETEGLEAGGGVKGGDVLVAGGGAATVKIVVGEEGHVGVDFV